MTMEIERAGNFDRFSVVNMQIIENSAMSWRARMILIYLQSRPPGWKTSAELLAKQGTEGRDAIRTSLKELEQFGYIERIKFQNERGHWNTKLRVHQYPITGNGGETAPDGPPPGDSDDDDEPTTDFQASVESPAADFQSSVPRPSVNQSSLTNTDTYHSRVKKEVDAAAAAPSSETPPPSSSSSPPAGTSPATTSREELPIHVIEFRRRGYWPSPETEAEARAIARYMDITESVGNYRRWCARNNRKPNDMDWSGWFARDEREARERITAQKEAQADLQLAAKLGGTTTKKKFNPNAVAE